MLDVGKGGRRQKDIVKKFRSPVRGRPRRRRARCKRKRESVADHPRKKTRCMRKLRVLGFTS